MATNIKITDTRYGESFRTGINGILYDIPVNTEVKVEDALAEHIRGLGVAFEEPRERSSKGASGSEEGSGDVLAPVSLGFGGSSTVEAPAMRPKSVGSGSGTQPGDVTSAGGQPEVRQHRGRHQRPAPPNGDSRSPRSSRTSKPPAGAGHGWPPLFQRTPHEKVRDCQYRRGHR